MTEVWKGIPGHPGYEASSFGRVRSIDRITTYERHDGTRSRLSKGRVLRQYHPKQKGKTYARVTLTGDVTVQVHRIVCLTFHGEPPEGKPWALHRDGDFTHNDAENLYWGSPQENTEDRRKHGHLDVKLTEADRQTIREQFKSGVGRLALTKLWGVDRSHIFRITKS